MYAVMIPFLGIGTDQLAERVVGEPGTENNARFEGNDGTMTKKWIRKLETMSYHVDN